jgi:lysozyme
LAKTSKTTKESVVDSMSELDNLYDTADDASMSTSPGTVSDKPYVNLISRFEGMKTEAYWDNTGKVWTIGKGTTTYRDGTPVKKGDKVSKEEADNLLQDFVDTKIIPQLSTKIPTWNEMNPNQQAALISFAYNVGPNFYGQKGFETLTKAVSSVDSFDQVPRALRLYTKSGGKKLKGLVKRRNAEATLWQS